MTYYDAMAKGYDELHKEEQLRKLHIILDQTDSESGPLLDVGCGTGFSLDIFAKHFNTSCYGIDPSQALINQYQGKEHILLSRAESLPFPDGHFGIITSITAIHNFDDHNQGLSEMYRVAKKGALIIISCLKKSKHLNDITKDIAEQFTVEHITEETQDIIFFCRKL